MERTVRPIEMYVGNGTDSGTWHTEYIDIPIDTPEVLIDEVAIEKAKEEIESFQFVGVYAVPLIEDLHEYDE